DVGNFTGIVELKCPKSSTHLSYLKARNVPENHKPQIYHNLWVSGAEWCDFVSYDPRFPEPLRLLVYRMWRVDLEVLAYSKVALKFLDEVAAECEAAKAIAATAGAAA